VGWETTSGLREYQWFGRLRTVWETPIIHSTKVRTPLYISTLQDGDFDEDLNGKSMMGRSPKYMPVSFQAAKF